MTTDVVNFVMTGRDRTDIINNREKKKKHTGRQCARPVENPDTQRVSRSRLGRCGFRGRVLVQHTEHSLPAQLLVDGSELVRLRLGRAEPMHGVRRLVGADCHLPDRRSPFRRAQRYVNGGHV